MSAPARFNPPTEDDLREFIDLSLNFLCIAGTDGYFKHVNPAWETTFGYTKEEVLSRPYLEFVHPDDREATIAEATNIASGRSTLSFENRYRCKDGSYRWLLWSAVVRPERGLIYCISGGCHGTKARSGTPGCSVRGHARARRGGDPGQCYSTDPASRL